MSTDHNRIKVADLETNEPGKILITNVSGELEFQDAKNIKSDNYNALDYTDEGKALDARQGKVLKDIIDNKSEDKSNKTDDIEANKASSVKYTSAKSVVDWLKSFLFSNTSPKATTLVDSDLILTGDSEDSFKTKTRTFAQLKANLKTYFDTVFQSVLVSGSTIKTVNGTSLLGSGNVAVPDMDTTTAQTVSGVKTFLTGMFGLRNVANTFTSFFTNTNTASRTYTLPDKSGTVAMTSDITAQLSGTVNKLVKFGTSTTGLNSRITDDGSNLGIDTVNIPLKDITLNSKTPQKNIGIEDSDGVTKGKDLIVSAGRTVNFIISFLLQPLNFISGSAGQWFTTFTDNSNNVYYGGFRVGLYKQTNSSGGFNLVSGTPSMPNGIMGGCVTASNDIYILGKGSDIYKQTGGTGAWVSQGAGSNDWRSICSTPNGDVYASVSGTSALGGSAGDIYKQTGGTGAFVAMGFPSRNYSICSTPNGDVYACVINGSIYKIEAGTSILIDLIQTNRLWYGITSSPSGGDIYACVAGAVGNIYKQTGGTGSFVGTGQINRNYYSIAISSSSNLYTMDTRYSGDSFYVNINSNGTANLDGGTIKTKAGTGKGTGKSYNERYTGQKTLSGTNMQIDTLRDRIDENGYYMYYSHPTYANDADADADSNLPSKAYYKITGNRGIFQKP